MPRRRAFTLVELLVAVAIVAVLVSLLLPSLGAARDAGRATACASNLRQLVVAGDLYATDHADRYAPGAPDALGNLTRWHGARGGGSDPFSAGGGTLSAYFGEGPDRSAPSGVRTCPTFSRTTEALAAARVGFERSAGGYGYNNAFVGTDRAAVPAAGRSRVWVVVTDRAGSARSRFASPVSTLAFADAALADGNRVAGVIEYSFAEPRFWPDAPPRRPDPSLHFRHSSPGSPRAEVAWLDGHAGAEPMTHSAPSLYFAADPRAHRIGWTGAADDNSLYDYE